MFQLSVMLRHIFRICVSVVERLKEKYRVMSYIYISAIIASLWRRNVFAAGLEWKPYQYIIFLSALLYPPRPRGHHSWVPQGKKAIMIINSTGMIFLQLANKNIVIWMGLVSSSSRKKKNRTHHCIRIQVLGFRFRLYRIWPRFVKEREKKDCNELFVEAQTIKYVRNAWSGRSGVIWGRTGVIWEFRITVCKY